MMLTGHRIYNLQRCKYVTGSFLLGFVAGLAVFAQLNSPEATDQTDTDQPGNPGHHPPFSSDRGEHEIIADHNVGDNMLNRIQINGVDITGQVIAPIRGR